MENNINNELKEMFNNIINEMADIVAEEEKKNIKSEGLTQYINDLENAINIFDTITKNKKLFNEKEFNSWIEVTYITSHKLYKKCEKLAEKMQKEQIERLMKEGEEE